MSSITPTAADPTHLEQDIHSGPLDLNIITSLLTSTIEVRIKDEIFWNKMLTSQQVKISSVHGGQLMSPPSNTTLVLHWAVDLEDNGEWNRPPKQMLPPGTTYRHVPAAPGGTPLR